MPRLDDLPLPGSDGIDVLIRTSARVHERQPSDAAKFWLIALMLEPALAQACPPLGQALLATGRNNAFSMVAYRVRQMGLALVQQGDIDAGARFFAKMAPTFPDPCAPYAALFAQINALTATYRSLVAPPQPSARRRYVIVFAVWGQRYVDMFTRYCIPSLLSPGNLPALREIRDVHVDIYSTPTDAAAIQRSPGFQKLAALANVQFTIFAPEILESPEYSRAGSSLRYWIFGGFHHLSIEHARALDADISLITPDCVYSDGILTNYARFVDQGYHGVLGSAIRGQAETLLPIVDRLRNDAANVLTMSPRQIVDVDTQNVHHSYKGFILTKGNRDMPADPSVLVFPHPQGFYLRCFHIHPVMLSAEAIKKDIVFDYCTVDSNAVMRFFPTEADWQRLKIIQDSDDGMILEFSYAYGADVPAQNREFTLDHLLDRASSYLPMHFWAFQHRINFHGDTRIDAIGTFDKLPDGTLKRCSLPVASKIDLDDEQIAAWFEAHRPRTAA